MGAPVAPIASSSPFERDVARAAAGEVVLVADAEMRYLAVSDGACRVLGYTRGELLAMRVPDVVEERDAADRYRSMIETGNQDGAITLVCKDGRRLEALYRAREAHTKGLTYYVSHLTPVAPVAASPRKMRLVIADDDASTRLLISTLVSFVDHVEVVGEAVDGGEAVRLVQEHSPDLVLLDVQMPRLDGLAAAEMIKALRPRTHVVLHSGEADERMRRRAATVGLRLLDKMQVEQVVETLVHPEPAEATELPDPRIESAVLTALIARTTTPVMIVCADRSVPFYNALAADLLGLPLPARPTNIDTVRSHYQVLRADDRTPVDPQDRPVERSAAGQEPIAETLIVSRAGTETLCRFTSVPFFGETNRFLGAALYIEAVANLREIGLSS